MAVRTLVGRALAGKAAYYSMRLSAAAALVALIALSGLSAPAQAEPTIDLTTDFDVRADGFRDLTPPDDSVANAGYSVSGAGDVNGDNIQDFIVGAPTSTHNLRSSSGSTYVVFGKKGGLPEIIGLEDIGEVGNSQGFRIDGAAMNDWAGYSVAGAGDVDGDGLDDVIVGAWGANNGPQLPPSEGSVYVIFGAPSLSRIDLTDIGEPGNGEGFRIDSVFQHADPIFNWGDPGNLPSNWVSGAGDVNDDGIDDVIVGADGADNNGYLSGSAYVIYGGSRDDLLGGVDVANIGNSGNSQGVRIDGAASLDRAGLSVSGAGDVNGDGIDDVIVGADRSGYGTTPDNGSAYVIFGGDDLPESVDLGNIGTEGNEQGVHLDNSSNNIATGHSVAGAGDVNGDGLHDVIVGAIYTNWPPSGWLAGSAYVIFGGEGLPEKINLDSIGTPENTQGFRIDGVLIYDYAGWSVAGAGDVNGDGLDDMIVGAMGANKHGSAYVIFGDGDLPPDSGVFDLADIEDSTWGFRMDGRTGGDGNDRAGYSVAGTVDVNDDGCTDMIVGAPTAQNAGQSTGSAYVVYGCEAEAEVVDSSCDGDPYNNDFAIHDFRVDTPDSHRDMAVSRLTSTFLVCGTNLGPSNEGTGTLVDHIDLLEAPLSWTSYTGIFPTGSYAGRLAGRMAYHDVGGNPKIEETNATLRVDPLRIRPLGNPHFPPRDDCNREAEGQVNPDFDRDLLILSCFKVESNPGSSVAWHSWVWGTISIVGGHLRRFLVLGPIHLDDRADVDAGLTKVDELTVCGYLGVVGGSSCGKTSMKRRLHSNGIGFRYSNPCGMGRGIFEVSATNKNGDVVPALSDDPVDFCVEWTGGLAISTPPNASSGLRP